MEPDDLPVDDFVIEAFGTFTPPPDPDGDDD